jgi:hypothetical protein
MASNVVNDVAQINPFQHYLDVQMPMQERIMYTGLFFAFYFVCLVISFKIAVEPQMLIKEKWAKMTGSDYWLHYLEWVSIVHAVLTVII